MTLGSILVLKETECSYCLCLEITILKFKISTFKSRLNSLWHFPFTAKYVDKICVLWVLNC